MVIVAIVGISAFYFFGNENKSEVKKSAPESDAARQEVNLSFDGYGRVSDVRVSVGDTVTKGQILATLENEYKLRELEEAKDNLRLQEETLNKLISSFNPKELIEIEKQKAKVESAKNSLDSAQRDLISILNKAFKSADETIRNNIDQFIDDPSGANPKISFFVSDSNLKKKIELARFTIEVVLNDWSDIASDLTIESGLLSVLEEVKDELGQIKLFLDDVSTAVNSLTESDGISQETIDGYILSVSTANAEIDSALSDILAAEKEVKEIEVLLALEQNEFENKTEGTIYEEVLVQEAVVEKAKTLVENIQMEVDETYLISPIDGVVAEQTAEVGETVSAEEVVAVIIPKEETMEEETMEADEEEIQATQTDIAATDQVYSDPTDPGGPVTVKLLNGDTLELWPGWK